MQENVIVFFIVLIADIMSVQQMLAAYTIIFDDVPTICEKRMTKKWNQALTSTPHIHNVSLKYSHPNKHP
jgi:hypothetical protein